VGISCEMAIFSPTTNSFQTEVPILRASGDRLVGDYFVDARLKCWKNGLDGVQRKTAGIPRRKITSAK